MGPKGLSVDRHSDRYECCFEAPRKTPHVIGRLPRPELDHRHART
jgi:hypothetical protein